MTIYLSGHKVLMQRHRMCWVREPNRSGAIKNRTTWLVSRRAYRQLQAEQEAEALQCLTCESLGDPVPHYPTEPHEEFTTQQLAQEMKEARTGDV